MLDAQALQKEINEIAFGADDAADLEYRVQSLVVMTMDDPDGIKADASTQVALEDLADELSDVIIGMESARDELRAIASRLEDEAAEADDEED